MRLIEQLDLDSYKSINSFILYSLFSTANIYHCRLDAVQQNSALSTLWCQTVYYNPIIRVMPRHF